MPKRASKEDVSQTIARVVAHATHGECVPKALQKPKNPAAVALGRLGGLKGGPARAAALSKSQRQEIGRKAAAARWSGQI
jgi:hypothetical protein